MAVDTRSRHLFESRIRTPLGSVGSASVVQDSRWDFDGPRTIFFYSITYILEGRCRYVEPGGRDMVLGPGTAFFCFPGIPHRIEPMPDEQFSELWITFLGPVFDLWRETRMLDPDRFCLDLHPIDHWLTRFETLFVNVRPDVYGQILLVNALQSVIAEAMSVQRMPVADPDRVWLAEAKAIIDSVLRADELDLEAVATQMGMSYSHFRRKFVAFAGIPPRRYHTAKLMQRACEWMHSSSTGNKELAEWFGFCNEFHFSKRFKEVIGMSPREFRTKLQRDPTAAFRELSRPIVAPTWEEHRGNGADSDD